MPFHLAVAPGLLKASGDGRAVTAYSRRDATEFFDAGGRGGFQPGIEIAGFVVLSQVAKHLRQSFWRGSPWTAFRDGLDREFDTAA